MPECREVVVVREFALPGAVGIALVAAAIAKPQFFDPLSLILIFGGAFTALGFSFSSQQLRQCTRAIGDLFRRSEQGLQEYVAELSGLTEEFRLRGLRGLESREKLLHDPDLKHGVELLVDLHSAEAIRARMEQRFTAMLGAHEINRQILLTLGKLLPSFGLIGTLVGMVLVLGNLADQDTQSLPAALGLALLTTLYGALAANLLVAPLLARLQAAAVERELKMRVTRDWLQMIVQGKQAALADSLGRIWPVAIDERPWRPQWAALELPAER
jgi:chemotaxis protein MotA